MNRRLFFILALTAVFLLTACAGVNTPARTGSQAAKPEVTEAADEAIRIFITVDCALVLENERTKQTARDIVAVLIGRGHCDEKGLFFQDELVLAKKNSAYDALLATGLRISYRESAFGPFVMAIEGLGEGDGGATSGWVYLVNGKAPAVSSGLFSLSDGDVVQWRYSVEESDLMGDQP